MFFQFEYSINIVSIYNITIKNDEQAMEFALQQAKKGMFIASPNPRVGCVIVKDMKIIGVGFTQPCGGKHAELQALEDVKIRGNRANGSTVYVTLEPCSHFGHTPPCVDALIHAGVNKVVSAIVDPNPLVSGQGLQKLKISGIIVICGVLLQQAYELNIGFFKRMRTGIPWIRLKSAASLDGKTALYNGKSQWITSKKAREDGHFWRARACGIMTGIGTINHDNPRLNSSVVVTAHQPRRIVVDSTLSLLPTAKILEGGGTLIFTATANHEKIATLEARGVEVIILPNANNKVHLFHMFKELGNRQFNEIHIEAGAILNASLLQDNCVDELLIYLAPKLIGDAYGMFALPALEKLYNKWILYFHDIQKIGEDLRILARFK